jgi:hypothetical protein
MNRDFAEMLDALSAAGAEFLIVGAHALAAHGRPRATGDLDILVEPTPENARRLRAVLTAFGFPALARAADRFAVRDQMASLGGPPLRIDLMTSISGVSFARAWKGRVRVPFGRHRIGFLGRAEFVANKRAAGRAKDLLDVALLEEARPKRRSRRRRR